MSLYLLKMQMNILTDWLRESYKQGVLDAGAMWRGMLTSWIDVGDYRNGHKFFLAFKM